MKMITLAGTVGKDAVLRRTQGGEPVLGFSVAVDDGYGENKTTMWFDINVWGKRGQSLEAYLTKGTRVTVCGEFGARQHDSKTYFTCRASDITIQGSPNPKPKDNDSYGQQPADFGGDEVPF